ncbi:acyltransferase [Flavobacterium sp.]|uniref:acyltransferase family protein n=1 Tax=Flavobacterium sp. TaxID=239 RepID=UPI0025B9638F|nr:acyltransferase [Flavobacterium sp.]
MLDKIGPGTFRYFLCFVVVLFHSTNLIAIGELAVHVFFILSGYWVMKMYKEKYMDFKHPLTSFWFSRLLRLLPIFYVTNILLVLVSCLVMNITPTAFIDSFKPSIGFLFSHIFILGLTQTGQINPPSWSLDIEMQFYILVPVFFWIISKNKKRSMLLLVTGILFFSGFYMLHESWNLIPSVANYLCFFLAGVALYESGYHASEKVSNLTVLISVFFVILTYSIPTLFENVILNNALRINGILFRIIFDYVLAFLMIPFISRNVRTKSTRWDRDLANLSYVTYLFHRVSMVPWAYYYAHLPLWDRMPSFIIYLVATFIGSIIIYYIVDIPFERLRKKIVS